METAVAGRAEGRRALWIALWITLLCFLVETIGAVWTNSLALLGDAAHMLIDIGGLALAIFAARMPLRRAKSARSCYSAQTLALLINAGVLTFFLFWLYEVLRRFEELPDVASVPMLVIGAAGLVVHVMRKSNLNTIATESPNIQRAILGGVGCRLASFGVVVAGIIQWTMGWDYADLLFGFLIGLFILPRTWNLLNVLSEGVPISDVDRTGIEQAILEVDGVAEVSDVHVRTQLSGCNVLNVHVLPREGFALAVSSLSDRVAALANERFGFDDTSVHVEQRANQPKKSVHSFSVQ